MRYREILLVLVAALVLVACNENNIKRQASSLEDAITEYNKSLRWGMFNNVDAYNRTSDGKQMPINRDAMKNIRITDYEIISKVISPDATKAIVKGDISYYNDEYGVLKKIPFEQHWWYDAGLKHWFTDSSLPAFK